MREKILAQIFSSIDELNEIRTGDAAPLNKQEDTVLYGDASALDSLSLANLLVEVEDACSTLFGIPLTLVDERALSQTNSPFRTIGTLASYISDLICDAKK